MVSSKLDSIQVLLVDDEFMILRLVTDVMAHLGFHNISVAHDGQEAIELVKNRNFDIIITDWRMPNVEGIDLIRFLRNAPQSQCQRAPVIMLTGNTEATYILQARDAGVNEYMVKPFSAAELAKRLRSIIEKPRGYVEAPTYHGPNRRWHDVPVGVGKERRKRAA